MKPLRFAEHLGVDALRSLLSGAIGRARNDTRSGRLYELRELLLEMISKIDHAIVMAEPKQEEPAAGDQRM